MSMTGQKKRPAGAGDDRGYVTTRIPTAIHEELRVYTIRKNISMTEIMDEATRLYCAKHGIPLPDDNLEQQQEPASRIA